jgi:hypothetical protein
MITFVLYWLATGSTLWAIWVLTGTFRLKSAPSRAVALTASAAMIVCWPLFAWKWLRGAWRMWG